MLSYYCMDYAIVFILGLIWGSFANVCIWRIPQGISIISPRSHCPKCKEAIPFYDNIPIISFILLKGKCRKCGEKISIIYPLVEFLTGILALLSYLKGGFSPLSIYYFLLSFLFLLLFFMDLKFRILPDSITLGGAFFSFFYSLIFKISPPYLERLGAGALGSFLFLFVLIFYFLIKGIYGIGYGDIKLVAFIGITFGIPDFLFVIIGGSIFALLFYIPFVLIKKKRWIIPFGTFLSLFSTIYLFYK